MIKFQQAFKIFNLIFNVIDKNPIENISNSKVKILKGRIFSIYELKQSKEKVYIEVLFVMFRNPKCYVYLVAFNPKISFCCLYLLPFFLLQYSKVF
jgi:hypothetical protein